MVFYRAAQRCICYRKESRRRGRGRCFRSGFGAGPFRTHAYALQNAVGLALLGFWVIFSTFAAPIIIHKVLVAGTLAGAELLSGALNTVIHTATTAAAAGGAALVAGRPAATAAASAATAGTLAIFVPLTDGVAPGEKRRLRVEP